MLPDRREAQRAKQFKDDDTHAWELSLKDAIHRSSATSSTRLCSSPARPLSHLLLAPPLLTLGPYLLHDLPVSLKAPCYFPRRTTPASTSHLTRAGDGSCRHACAFGDSVPNRCLTEGRNTTPAGWMVSRNMMEPLLPRSSPQGRNHSSLTPQEQAPLPRRCQHPAALKSLATSDSASW